MATTPEGEVVRYLVRKCKDNGFQQRKVSYEGHIGAPDRLVFGRGVNAWVELKAYGRSPTIEQAREHERLRLGGMKVYICDSKDSVDTVIRLLVQKAEALEYVPEKELRISGSGNLCEYVSVAKENARTRRIKK